MKKIYAKILLLTALIIIAGCSNPIPMPPDSEAFYRVTSPDQRINDQDRYFKDEYGKVSEKRKNMAIYSGTGIKPTKLVGLGLSGGGIRSSAYQLGFLAGMQQSKLTNDESVNKELTILDRTDYLSCVSGGCWATGAFLIANEPKEAFF